MSGVYLIGITGASGSGKSTLAKQIMDELACSTLYLTQDMYYKNALHLTEQQRKQLNYDAPQTFDFALLRRDLKELVAGRPIERREYDFVHYRRYDKDELLPPAQVLILEGIHVFYDDEIRSMLDLKIFVQLDADLCILRRLRRDLLERGRTVDSGIEQYVKTVKPMYETYIRNYASMADIVMPNVYESHKAVEIIVEYVNNATAPQPCPTL